MCRFTSILTFIFLISEAACSPTQAANNSTRIIGGSPAPIERYPYTVQVNQNSQLICGGTLVSRRVVLSSAHCFVDRDNPVPRPSVYSVRVGSSTLNSGGTVYRVSTIVTHHAYNMVNHDNDVAVMVLTVNATLGPTVGVANLPPMRFTVPDNETMIHVGWGKTAESNTWLSPVLNDVTVRKVNHSTCVRQYSALQYEVTSNMICAGLLGIGGADACQGDSGGPLIHSGLVVGVTSWGLRCASPQFPGVSARVANYTDWVQAMVVRYNGSPALSALNAFVLMLSLFTSLAVIK